MAAVTVTNHLVNKVKVGKVGKKTNKEANKKAQQMDADDESDDDEEADRAYIRLFGMEEHKRMGKPYDLEYAEYHYYFPPGGTFPYHDTAGKIDAYVKDNAVKL